MLNSYEINRKPLWLALLNFLLAAFIIYQTMNIVNYFWHPTVEDSTAYSIRVVANSNAADDQLQKEQLSASIYSHIEAQKLYNESVQVTAGSIYDFISENYPQIPIRLSYGQHVIPPKYVDNRLYPQALQQSIVIKLGSGRGDNWFCAVFPNVCKAPEEKKTNNGKSYKWFFQRFFHKDAE